MGSRCMRFEFQPLPRQEHINHLKLICKKENIEIVEQGDPESEMERSSLGALEMLVGLACGDLRKSTNLLQMAHTVFGSLQSQDKILRSTKIANSRETLTLSGIDSNFRVQLSRLHFDRLSQRVPHEKFLSLLQICSDSTKTSHDLLLFVQNEILYAGHNFENVARDLFDFCRGRSGHITFELDLIKQKLSPLKIAYIGKLLAETHDRITLQGCRENVQFQPLMLSIRTTLLAPDVEFPPPLDFDAMSKIPNSKT